MLILFSIIECDLDSILFYNKIERASAHSILNDIQAIASKETSN
ncbi:MULTISPECIES: hypothetical protein [Spirulina sp. CCY15215]|nr:hypothetical protein [Spirulina major]